MGKHLWQLLQQLFKSLLEKSNNARNVWTIVESLAENLNYCWNNCRNIWTIVERMRQNLSNCWNNCRNIWTIVETIAETFEQLLKQLQKNWTIVETIAETLNNCWNNCGNMWYKFKCSPCNPSPEAFWKHSIYILTLYICCIEIYYLIIWYYPTIQNIIFLRHLGDDVNICFRYWRFWRRRRREKKLPLCNAVTRSHCMDIADEIERFIWMIKHDKPWSTPNHGFQRFKMPPLELDRISG